MKSHNANFFLHYFQNFILLLGIIKQCRIALTLKNKNRDAYIFPEKSYGQILKYADVGYQSPYLMHAKHVLYHLSYIPNYKN